MGDPLTRIVAKPNQPTKSPHDAGDAQKVESQPPTVVLQEPDIDWEGDTATEKTCRFWFEASDNLASDAYENGVNDLEFLADLHRIDDTLLQSSPEVLAVAKRLMVSVAEYERVGENAPESEVLRRGEDLAIACLTEGIVRVEN